MSDSVTPRPLLRVKDMPQCKAELELPGHGVFYCVLGKTHRDRHKALYGKSTLRWRDGKPATQTPTVKP
jgi:hypothetical protein